jgi:WASH complex subunit 7
VDPIALEATPYEQTNLLELITTDNRVFNKILKVFAWLSDESRLLESIADDKFYAPLLLFGEELREKETEEGEIQLQIARMLPLIVELSQFVDRVNVVFLNGVRQLAALYHERQPLYVASFNRVHLRPAVDALGRLLTILITLDEIASKNVELRNGWQKYKRMARIARDAPAKYGVTDAVAAVAAAGGTGGADAAAAAAADGDGDDAKTRLTELDRVLYELKGQLFDGNLFSNCTEQEFDFEGLIEVRTNRAVKSEVAECLRTLVSDIQTFLGGPRESDERRQLVALHGLYAFFIAQWQDPSDRKLFRAIWSLQTAAATAPLFACTRLHLAAFLIRHVPMMTKLLKNAEAEAEQMQRGRLAELDKGVEATFESYRLQASVWMARMESNMTNRAALDSLLDARATLLAQGVRLGVAVLAHVQESLELHVSLSAPLGAAVATALVCMLELLKAIEATYHRRAAVLASTSSAMVQLIARDLQQQLAPVRARLEGARRFGDAELDGLAAVSLCIQMLNGPGSQVRLDVFDLALEVVVALPFVNEADAGALRVQTRRLRETSEWPARVQRATNCAFTYWARALLPHYLAAAWEKPVLARRLPYALAALRDAAALLRRARHVPAIGGQDLLPPAPATTTSTGVVAPAPAPDEHEQHQNALLSEGDWRTMLLAPYEKAVVEQLQAMVLDKLCAEIETELRFHIHAHLGVTERNPFKHGVRDVSHWLRLPPLRVFGTTIDVKRHVEHYLDVTFYNLNTVALFDWQTYGEMRNLAHDKYDLVLMETHLPAQTLEHGLDVLEIMRNIHVFARNYTYNLNQQIFVENSGVAGKPTTGDESDGAAASVSSQSTAQLRASKTLNTINVQMIAGSIRTHGIGIMNTTVNFTYQFLRHRFVRFSQFLYDDIIRSRLHKDIKWFTAPGRREELSNQYPFARAAKFHADIRKLGVNDSKETYLDRFRVLITQIGNAMGYVRTVRTAGRLYVSNAIRFVPDLEGIIKFEELCATSHETTRRAAANLDTSIETLRVNFEEGTEYFRLLVRVFAAEFRAAANAHMKAFHVIVPPLTVNFVTHLFSAKQRIGRQGRQGDGALFCDDGFAMGVAYVLKLLDLEQAFLSLHWFDAVKAHYMNELRDARSDAAKANKNERRAAELRAEQIEATLREYELLRFSFSSARIFFQDAEIDLPTDTTAPPAASTDDAAAAPAAAAAAAPEDNSNDAAPIGAGAPPPPPPPPPPSRK